MLHTKNMLRYLSLFCILLPLAKATCLPKHIQLQMSYPEYTNKQQPLHKHNIGKGKYTFNYDSSTQMYPIRFIQDEKPLPVSYKNSNEFTITIDKPGDITYYNSNHPLEMAGTMRFRDHCTPLGSDGGEYGGGGGGDEYGGGGDEYGGYGGYGSNCVSEGDRCEPSDSCCSGSCKSGNCTSLPTLFSYIDAGNAVTCAIEKDTEFLYCWGENDDGQLGDGTTTNRNIPTQVLGLTNVKHVSVGGSHVCAVAGDDRKVYCWGENADGQVGNGESGPDAADVQTPQLVKLNTSHYLKDVYQISTGNRFTCAIAGDDRKVYCWGKNADGQVGNGESGPDAADVTAPQKVKINSVEYLQDVHYLATGLYSTCAVVGTQKELYCWGYNGNKLINTVQKNSAEDDIKYATKFNATNFTSIDYIDDVTITDQFLIFIDRDGIGYGWGSTSYGKMCKASGQDYHKPMICDSPFNNSNIMVSAYSFHTCILKTDNKVYCFGANWFGQLGIGSKKTTEPANSSPVIYASSNTTVTDVKHVTAGATHACLLKKQWKSILLGIQ